MAPGAKDTIATATADEITLDLLPLLRIYKGGRTERFMNSPIVPPSPQGDPQTTVSSKDIVISPTVSARLYLPTAMAAAPQKLPLLLYFRGSGFCVESAFSFLPHRYISLLSARATALVVSVEYRLAPEYLLPAAYDDAWDALQWLLSHAPQEILTSSNDDQFQPEQWLLNHGDFDRLFIGGDSSGGNIAHNVSMRGGFNGLTSRIRGLFLSQPYFWGSARIGFEMGKPDADMISRLWVFASGGAGLDDPRINPVAHGAPSLAGLGCSRSLLVCVAGEDTLKERGKAYYEVVKRSGWDGEVELFEVDGGGTIHGFHVFDTESEKSELMVGRLASFLNQ